MSVAHYKTLELGLKFWPILGHCENRYFSVSHADCADRYFSEPTGQISSQNYPMAYDNNRDCSNYITVPTGQTIIIEFLAFSTELSNDWVMVRAVVSNANI